MIKRVLIWLKKKHIFLFELFIILIWMKKEWGGKKYVADLRVSRVRRCEFCKHSEYSQLRLSPQLGNAATYDRITYVGSCTVVFIHKNLIHFKKTRKREVKRIKESQKRHTRNRTRDSENWRQSFNQCCHWRNKCHVSFSYT